MHVSTNSKSKEPLKLTFTEKNRLDQAEQVAKAVGGGALMLGDMELREVADKAQIALVKLKLFLSDKRPAPETKQSDAVDPEQLAAEAGRDAVTDDTARKSSIPERSRQQRETNN